MAFKREDGFLPVCKGEVEFTNVELVSFLNALGVDAVSLELNAVCGIEIFYVIGPVFKDDRTMLTGNIAISNDEVGKLRRTAYDVLVFFNRIALVPKNDIEGGLSLRNLLVALRIGLRLRNDGCIILRLCRLGQGSKYHGFAARGWAFRDGFFKNGRRTAIILSRRRRRNTPCLW